MGIFNGQKNQPNIREPRPKGAQKGVAKRVHDRGVPLRGATRSPWVRSGKGSDGFEGGRNPRW